MKSTIVLLCVIGTLICNILLPVVYAQYEDENNDTPYDIQEYYKRDPGASGTFRDWLGRGQKAGSPMMKRLAEISKRDNPLRTEVALKLNQIARLCAEIKCFA